MKYFQLFFLCLLGSLCFGQNTIYMDEIHLENGRSFSSELKNYRLYKMDFLLLNEILNRSDETKLTLDFGGDHLWPVILEPSNLIADNTILRISTPSGINEQFVPKFHLMTGVISTDPLSSVRLTVRDQFVHGNFRINGEEFFIQPAQKFDSKIEKGIYVLYKLSDIIDQEGQCGTDHSHIVEKSEQDGNNSRLQTGDCYRTQLAIATDYLYFNQEGPEVGDVVDQVVGVMNDVANNYEYLANGDNFDDGVEFEIVEIWASTCEECDPWTNSTAHGTLLSSFMSWGQGGGFNKSFDLGQIWTGRDFNGGVVGVAYLDAVCSSFKYQANQNYTNNSESLRVLVAHETGHNFSANHDASNSETIMRPSIFLTHDWSSTSQSDISAAILSYGCLDQNCDSEDCDKLENLVIDNITDTGFDISYDVQTPDNYRIRVKEIGANTFFYTLNTSSNNLTVSPPDWETCVIYEIVVEHECSGEFSNPITAVVMDDTMGCPPDACEGTDLLLSGTLANGIYKAFSSITSDGTIPANGNVRFEAGEFIELDGDFEVELDGVFEAVIDTCDNN